MNKLFEPLLCVQALTVALPPGSDRPYAIEQVSFDVNLGETVCIVGESSSGKSVSAHAIMGLLPVNLKYQAGQVLFKQRDLMRQSEAAWQALRGKDISMIFQEPRAALNPLMKIGDQIAEGMVVRGIASTVCHRRALELLELVELSDPIHLQSRYPFQLSGGQCQRVMIAMALALEPAILIADEPTTALDVTTQAQILTLLKRIQRSMGMGLLFITHDFSVVADIADHIVVMQKGKVIERGSANQVLEFPQETYTQQLIAAVPYGGKNRVSRLKKTTPLLAVKHLEKSYTIRKPGVWRKQSVQALQPVSFNLFSAQTLGIVGESGSGKSTLAKCLLKLIDFDKGEIWLKGRNIAQFSQRAFRPYRASIQMIFQDPFASLNPCQTIGNILTAGPRAQGVSCQTAVQQAQQWLAYVGLVPTAFHRYPQEFSGGQRQRIGIARALMLAPEILVADESLSALDVAVQAQILSLLKKLQQKLKLAIIFITHDLRVAAEICHQIIVMHQGYIVEQGTPKQVLQRPRHAYTQRLVTAIPGKRWSIIKK
jgi:peptide/nickel transport system ATP-binding protein